ncbi:MAG: SCO1664 family protein [Ilumatobacter sp.]|nr:SCO1664 family protein [Ilumatobacter sp.]
MPSDELTGAATLLASDPIPDPVAFLLHADVEIEGRMPWSSNATFLAKLRCEGPAGPVEQRAIYKPVRGERPLWDFEPGLHKRERAAYLLSERLGFGVVPPTVLRDGPLGEGSFQWFVDADHSEHYFTIYEHYEHLHGQCRDIAVLDVLANNTDRKSGHCLLAGDRVWAIDNGLCFSTPFKLRTVIWEFAGESLEDDLLARIAPMVERIPVDIAALLDDDEILAMQRRASMLVTERALPADESGHRYPWPLI